jgi:lipopolysaccharide transport system ATP-binding protein
MAAIELGGVTKAYRIGVGRARVREMLPWPVDRGVQALFPRWWSRDTFNAVDDVSMSIPDASSVGVVGHNGAGKTTMLKLVAGVTIPTRGQVRVTGRIGALIDLLVGFHPDLTGEENVYLLGAMHGLNRRAMAARIERVFDFAEIHELAGTPVKRYSAGMQARLGFSTLVAVEPEILLIDEVLAVGDAAFQRKCADWLEQYRESGGTLVFVSHNLGLVRSMTDRVLWMDRGQIVADGPPSEILGTYAKAMERRDSSAAEDRRTRGTKKRLAARGMHRWGAGGARVTEVTVVEPEGRLPELEIVITYENTELERAVFCVGFVDESGQDVAVAASHAIRLGDRRGVVRCAIRPAPFRSGVYFPVAAILSPDGRVEDRWRLDRAIVIDRDGVTGLAEDFGPVDIPAVWSEG